MSWIVCLFHPMGCWWVLRLHTALRHCPPQLADILSERSHYLLMTEQVLFVGCEKQVARSVMINLQQARIFYFCGVCKRSWAASRCDSEINWFFELAPRWVIVVEKMSTLKSGHYTFIFAGDQIKDCLAGTHIFGSIRGGALGGGGVLGTSMLYVERSRWLAAPKRTFWFAAISLAWCAVVLGLKAVVA